MLFGGFLVAFVAVCAFVLVCCCLTCWLVFAALCFVFDAFMVVLFYSVSDLFWCLLLVGGCVLLFFRVVLILFCFEWFGLLGMPTC